METIRFKCPPALAVRVDAHAERLQRGFADLGITREVTRGEALESLLKLGADAAEGAAGESAAPAPEVSEGPAKRRRAPRS